MRINKYLALSGVASRRKAEELIKDGKIKVNGKVTIDLSTDIKPTDIVKYNNRIVRVSQTFVYYKLNKPKGYVSTLSDDLGRKTIMDLMRGVHQRVFPVGRLDYDTEGLILLTNDGEITNILTKPNSEIEKTYMAHIEGKLSNDEIKHLCAGVDIGGYVTKECSIRLIESSEKISKLLITITEGKNRQIRRMFDSINKPVTFLRRTQIGEIRLGGLSRGEYKELNNKEIKYLNSLKR